MRPIGRSPGLRRHGFALLCFLLSSTVPAPAERLSLRWYTAADGLGHDTVYKIVRDSRGFLWFCTFEGLSRFDGYGFTTYGVADGLPNQVVRDLLETRSGDYWVATAGGLALFDPGGVPRPTAPRSGGERSLGAVLLDVHLPAVNQGSRIVTSLVEDRGGGLWCGTLGGLYRVKRRNGLTEFRRVPSIPSVTAMLADRRGALWIGSSDGAIYRLNPGGSTDAYPPVDGAKGSQIQSWLEDREGRVWAGTTLAGLWRVVSNPDPSRVVVDRAHTVKDGLPTNAINALFQASDGTVWIGTNQGLVRAAQTTGGRAPLFRAYPDPQPDPVVHSVAEDGIGNLWLATNIGAAKLARNGITTFTDADGLSGASAMFTDREGRVVVLGGAHSAHLISRFDGERFTAIEPTRLGERERLWRESQAVLQDSAGEWWMGARSGLYHFPRTARLDRVVGMSPSTVYTTRDGLASNYINGVFEDSRRDVWVATARGLSRWERTSGTLHRYGAEDGWLWGNSPVSFAEDRSGSIWIGLSIGGGLVRYRDGRFTRFTTSDGLPAGGILQLFLDSSGRLWVPSSPGGVSRLDHLEAERPTIVPYTTAQGLAGNDVEAVAEDGKGRMYLASARGIDRLDPSTGHIRHYPPSEGTLRAGVNGALRDGAGAVWIRYENGLVRLVPEEVRSVRPQMLITGIRVAGEPQGLSALGQDDVAAIELPPERNQLQVDFVALGLTSRDGSRYEYRLEGGSGNWTAVGEERIVNFAHLAPGRYRFLVRATSADGVVSDTPASFAFTILTPIWQRWWFLTAAVGAVLVALYVAQRSRVTRLLTLERVRTRIAADLHDDIGSSLSQISVLSEVLRTQLGSQEPRISGNVALINRVSQETLDSMSDIVWAINPRQDHLSDLVRKMRRLASEILPARGIEFTFDAPPPGQDLTLGADVRRQLFLVFKEAVNNVVRHSKCSRSDIVLSLEGGSIALVIADNGHGFDPHQVFDGNGLVSLRRRASSLGGEATVSASPGAGTTVTVRIPHGHRWRGGGRRRRPAAP